MANKKVVGELVYEIRGDNKQLKNTIKTSDSGVKGLGKTVGNTSANMIRNLAGVYLGFQGLKKGIDATLGSAIRYEDAFAGVRKTVDGTEKELQALSDRFRELSKEIPISVNEFARIGELAGQLGVPIGQVDKFAESIAKIGVTTNLTTESASTAFARFANIMGTPLDLIENMGSAVVGLGNSFATTESEIVNFSLRVAGAGKIAGLTEAQVFGISTAFSSVGIQAEAGGTAVQKILIDLNNSVAEGGDKLKQFAIIAGLSAEDFAQVYQDDAGKAFDLFVKGLGNAGDDASQVLEELGFSDIRLQRAFLSLAGTGDLLTNAIASSTEEFAKNTALQIEAEKRFKTTASQIELLKNNFTDLGISIGTSALPMLNTFIKTLTNVSETINTLSDELLLTIKWLGTTVGLAWALNKAGLATKIFSIQAVTTTGIVGGLRTAILFLRTALLALPLALAITVGLVGYTAIMGQIKNLKRELNSQVEGEMELGDMRIKNTREARKLIQSENKNVQELGRARNALYTATIRNQDEGIKIDRKALQQRITNAKKAIEADEEALKIMGKSTKATEENADASNGLGKEYADMLEKIKALSSATKKNNDTSTEAEDKAKKLADNYESLGGKVEDLAYKGKQAITDLMESNVKDLEKIEDKINTLKEKIADLKSSLVEDLASEDLGIAEKIVAEERKIADLKIKLEKEKGKDKPTQETVTDLTAEIKTREDALLANAELEATLATELTEARRRADLGDLARSIEDYIAKKERIQLAYDDKKLALENELLLEEENKSKAIELIQDKQNQIDQIVELGNQRYQDLADNRVKITEEEVKKQIDWYNKLSDAIAKSKGATRTTELPQFAKGGYVSSGGEVHAGEYVIPASMVNANSGLIKALEGARTGATTNNNVTLNNSINEQIDMDAVLKSISFELNK
jgi:TP901 family phage tail tape measure protein